MDSGKPILPPLISFEFVSLCVFVFLAYCNISVFYSLYIYIEQLGIPHQWRGLVVSASSLSTILFFLIASPFLNARNANRCILAGIAVLVVCGVLYLYARTTTELLFLRLLNGVGISLLTASALTLLVAIIPPSRSGQAFGLYSAAVLLPYCVVPFAFDIINPLLPTTATGYALTSLALVPAAVVNALIARRMRTRLAAIPVQPVTVKNMLSNLTEPALTLLLLINSIYYLSFSALFFLSKGLFSSRGIENVGYFFSIQTICMLVTRLLGSRFFDRVDKLALIRFCYGSAAVSYGLLFYTADMTVFVLCALALGIGLGVGGPNLNALMYAISHPRFRAINSNLMMLSLHVGSFLGPILGGFAVEQLGYEGFLLVGAAANVVGLALSIPFAGRMSTNPPAQSGT